MDILNSNSPYFLVSIDVGAFGAGIFGTSSENEPDRNFVVFAINVPIEWRRLPPLTVDDADDVVLLLFSEYILNGYLFR